MSFQRESFQNFLLFSVKTKDENEKPIGNLSFPGRFLHAAQDGIGARRRAGIYRRHNPALPRRKEFERTFRHDVDGAFSGRAVRGDENPFVQSDDHPRLPAEQYDPRLAFCGFRTEEHGFDLVRTAHRAEGIVLNPVDRFVLAAFDARRFARPLFRDVDRVTVSPVFKGHGLIFLFLADDFSAGAKSVVKREFFFAHTFADVADVTSEHLADPEQGIGCDGVSLHELCNHAGTDPRRLHEVGLCHLLVDEQFPEFVVFHDHRKYPLSISV